MKFVKKVLIRTTLATNLVLINLAKMNQNFKKDLPNFFKASCSQERKIQRIFFFQKVILDYKYIYMFLARVRKPAFFQRHGHLLIIAKLHVH